MSKEKVKELTTVSSLLTGCGLLLMFLSFYFGTSICEIWLDGELSAGRELTLDYDLLVNNFVRNFVIIGSILFGSGVLVGVLSYLHIVLYGNKGNNTHI
ncbi:hypothetical protein FAY30_05000 [Bacillus sp. S3]|uniref:hypothetical protein n=1 Tax=Bacillus sp. S3 TaxID=486398 RepID=UPI001188B814|nr:hypothetical protein [Bacillus sp. S3]QCJ41302.1 hypothetical protein FAY30_05000 [Bacillus sp. S3]